MSDGIGAVRAVSHSTIRLGMPTLVISTLMEAGI